MTHHNPFTHHKHDNDAADSTVTPDGSPAVPTDEMTAGEKAELRRQLALEVETFEQGIEG